MQLAKMSIPGNKRWLDMRAAMKSESQEHRADRTTEGPMASTASRKPAHFDLDGKGRGQSSITAKSNNAI